MNSNKRLPQDGAVAVSQTHEQVTQKAGTEKEQFQGKVRQISPIESAPEAQSTQDDAGDLIQAQNEQEDNHRVLRGIAARRDVMLEREMTICEGRKKFSGKKVLFVLPISRPGGGGNVVVCEASAMMKMGVEVYLFNLNRYRDGFMQSYPELKLPTIFGEIEDLPAIAAGFDAVVATANYSVKWFEKIPPHICEALGYYVQGFEPLMYDPGTQDYQEALASYTLIPAMKCFTKTEWTARKVFENTGRMCKTVGISVDMDLMKPRASSLPDWPQRPIRIAAMIRPDSPYREPEKTMALLKQAVNTYQHAVEICIFGTILEDPEFQKLTQDFDWNLFGILTQRQMAHLFNEVDIFVDYSSHQAMGLSALEAMACGCAVIVPQEGGAIGFVKDRVDALVVDTRDYENVWGALQELIENHALRKELQDNAISGACKFYPERPALKILETLFEANA